MAGAYEPEQYQRDVVRLRIVRAQQIQQIKSLQEEIRSLRLKPLSQMTAPSPPSPPESYQSQIYLFMLPPPARQQRKKYFPTTPLGSTVKMVYDVNIMKLLYDCLDAMRVTRDDADQLLRELTAELPDVISGAKSRFEVVDTLVRKWLLKYGGDPSLYKKQTRAFDALAALADRLIRQHVEAMEGADAASHKVMESLEEALKDVSGPHQPLHQRLGPALAALMHTTQPADLESDETMTALVNSLVDEEHPLTADSISNIEIFNVVEDIKDCGVQAPPEELEYIVKLAIDCLRAQLVGSEEARQIDDEVEKALAIKDTKPSLKDQSPENRGKDKDED